MAVDATVPLLEVEALSVAMLRARQQSTRDLVESARPLLIDHRRKAG